MLTMGSYIYVATWGDKKGGRCLLEGAYYCKLMGTLIIFIKGKMYLGMRSFVPKLL